MHPFPPSPIPGDDTFRQLFAHALLSSTLVALAWFALRRRGPEAANSFSTWIVVWVAVSAATVVAVSNTPSTEWQVVYLTYSALATMCCFCGAIRNLLPSFREVKRRKLLSVSEACILIVVWIVLAALLAPAVQHGTSPGSSAVCKNRLKQLALVMHDFHDDHQRFPASAGLVTDAGPPVSWRITLLPYLDQQTLFEKYDVSAAWNQSPNSKLMSVSVNAYRCPAHMRATMQPDDVPRRTSFAVPIGSRTVFGNAVSPALSVDQISDGTSTTILIVEACGAGIIWSEPRDIDLSTTPLGVNLPGRQRGLSDGFVSGHHKAGAHVAMVDGSVRFLSSKTNAAVLQALLTATGDEGTGTEQY